MYDICNIYTQLNNCSVKETLINFNDLMDIFSIFAQVLKKMFFFQKEGTQLKTPSPIKSCLEKSVHALKKCVLSFKKRYYMYKNDFLIFPLKMQVSWYP